MKKLIGFATVVLFVVFGLMPQTAAAEYLAHWIDEWALALGVAGAGIGTLVVYWLVGFIKYKLGDKVGEYMTHKFENSAEDAEKLMKIMLDAPSAKQFIATKADLIAEKKDRLKAEALQLKYEIITLSQKIASGLLDASAVKETKAMIDELQARFDEINA